MLKEQFEELMKNIKCDLKNKPQIVQICQIFGKSPDEINKIVNKKKSIFQVNIIIYKYFNQLFSVILYQHKKNNKNIF